MHFVPNTKTHSRALIFLEFYIMKISNFTNNTNKNAHEMQQIFKNSEIANVLIQHFKIRMLRQICIVGWLYTTWSDCWSFFQTMITVAPMTGKILDKFGEKDPVSQQKHIVLHIHQLGTVFWSLHTCSIHENDAEQNE